MVIKRHIYKKSISKVIYKKSISKVTGGVKMNTSIQELQRKLSLNMNKAVSLANKNTVRDQHGHVVLKADDEWRNDDGWDE